MDGHRDLWTELYIADDTREQLSAAGVLMVDAALPIEASTSSLDDVRETEARCRCEEALGVCTINAKLLKAEYKAACMRSRLRYGNLIPFLLTRRGGWSSLSGTGKGTDKTAATTVVLRCSASQARYLPIYCPCEFAAGET